MASANSNSNAKRCPQWRFPANATNVAGVAHFSGCVCEELAKSKKACVCRPLAKPTGVPEVDALVNDWLYWDMNDCTRNQIIDLANKGNVPGEEYRGLLIIRGNVHGEGKIGVLVWSGENRTPNLGLSVCKTVRHIELHERFMHFCPCPIFRDWSVPCIRPC